ncbi:MAG TPA: hypothetical protein VE398_23915 [Acidobacteriota bacterium]|nr:hypothetical protein [Acidobacteriota bacterium]
MNLLDVLRSAPSFTERLAAAKAAMPDVRWYPYNTIMLVPNMLALIGDLVIPANAVLDVGAADGDLTFLFSEAGASVHALEHEATNFNDGEGLRRLNDKFGAKVTLSFGDLDFGFSLPRQYDLCLALGLAYHLRNIPLLYITLAQHCQFMITNTRVLDITPAGTDIASQPLAYFIERRELGNDPTNFWLVSPAGYRRILKRCGWKVLREHNAGEAIGTVEADKRMWAVCERVPNHADLKLHHDF